MPRGGACVPGLCIPGGYVCPGRACMSGGVCMARGCVLRMPPVNRMTDACENITLPKTICRNWLLVIGTWESYSIVLPTVCLNYPNINVWRRLIIYSWDMECPTSTKSQKGGWIET